MKQVNIRTPEETKRVMKDHKLSQGKLCEIMGMSKKSYKIIKKFLNKERELLDWTLWDNLQKYLDKK